jgi:hypothetical protein
MERVGLQKTALAKRPAWSTALPRPITLPQAMTLKTLADVRKLLGHIPKERRQLSTWQHVEKTLRECAAGDDPENISVALQIVLQGERVPHQIK